MPISAGSSTDSCSPTAESSRPRLAFSARPFSTHSRVTDARRETVEKSMRDPQEGGSFRPHFHWVFFTSSGFGSALRIRLSVIDFFLFPEVVCSHGIDGEARGFPERAYAHAGGRREEEHDSDPLEPSAPSLRRTPE